MSARREDLPDRAHDVPRDQQRQREHHQAQPSRQPWCGIDEREPDAEGDLDGEDRRRRTAIWPQQRAVQLVVDQHLPEPLGADEDVLFGPRMSCTE